MYRVGETPDLHRAKKLAHQIRRKAVLLQIVFRSETDISTPRQAIDVLAFGASDSSKVSATLELLIDAIDLQFCFGFVLGITVRDTLRTVVRRVNHDHGQGDSACVHELGAITVVILFDLAITDTDL